MKSTLSSIIDSSAHVLEQRPYLLSIYVFLTQNKILVHTLSVLGDSYECSNGALNVIDFVILSSFANIEAYNSAHRGLLTTLPILSGVVVFVGRIIIWFPIDLVCLSLLNIDQFYLWFSSQIILSILDLIMWIHLQLPVSC